jgi:two-component system, oxyanion-binding sensor
MSAGHTRILHERIRIGFMPLLDAALPVIAARCGFARRQGLEIELVRETSWANVRDRLAIGHFDAAHLLAPLPIAAAFGLTPYDVPMLAPMALASGGNAITVSRSLWAAMKVAEANVIANDPFSTGRALKGAIAARRERGEPPLAFAVVHPFSSHNYELRHWLAAAEIDPERDVAIAILPPPYMGDALKAGRIDGFCVGDPWNSRAARQGHGAVILTKAAIWPRSPDKVLAVRADWAEANRPVLLRLLTALLESARWCADPQNRDILVSVMSDESVLGVEPEDVLAALGGRMPLADGERFVPGMLEFEAGDALRVKPADARFYAEAMERWSQAALPADTGARLSRIFGTEALEEAAASLGIAFDKGADLETARLFDRLPR